MKKNILVAVAALGTLVVSSFTVKKTTTFYFDFNTGAHNLRGSYVQGTTSPGTVGGDNTVLDWFSVVDASNTVEDSEFDAVYAALNGTNPGTVTLDDELEQNITVSGQAVHMEKKP